MLLCAKGFNNVSRYLSIVTTSKMLSGQSNRPQKSFHFFTNCAKGEFLMFAFIMLANATTK